MLSGVGDDEGLMVPVGVEECLRAPAVAALVGPVSLMWILSLMGLLTLFLSGFSSGIPSEAIHSWIFSSGVRRRFRAR